MELFCLKTAMREVLAGLWDAAKSEVYATSRTRETRCKIERVLFWSRSRIALPTIALRSAQERVFRASALLAVWAARPLAPPPRACSAEHPA